MAKEKNAQDALVKDALPERKFSVETLGEHCLELFGCSSATFAGATFGMEGEYAVSEMRERIEAWSRKEAR